MRMEQAAPPARSRAGRSACARPCASLCVTGQLLLTVESSKNEGSLGDGVAGASTPGALFRFGLSGGGRGALFADGSWAWRSAICRRISSSLRCSSRSRLVVEFIVQISLSTELGNIRGDAEAGWTGLLAGGHDAPAMNVGERDGGCDNTRRGRVAWLCLAGASLRIRQAPSGSGPSSKFPIILSKLPLPKSSSTSTSSLFPFGRHAPSDDRPIRPRSPALRKSLLVQGVLVELGPIVVRGA
jgi:hypothetical protein